MKTNQHSPRPARLALAKLDQYTYAMAFVLLQRQMRGRWSHRPRAALALA